MKLTVCYQTPRKRQDMTRVKISKTACWCQVGWQPVIWDLVHLKWCPWTQTRLLFTPQMLFIYLLFFLIREGKIGFIVCQLSRQLSGKIIFNYELWCLRFVSWNPSPLSSSPAPRHWSCSKCLQTFFQLFEQISTPEIYFKHFSEGMEDSVGLTLEDLEVWCSALFFILFLLLLLLFLMFFNGPAWMDGQWSRLSITRAR